MKRRPACAGAVELTLKLIEDAASRIRDVAWTTPLLPASRDEDGKVLLKMEALQRTGSFKLRGAWNRMSRMSEVETRRGFVTVSAGNHGQAVAWCARKLGAPCTVFVPEGAVARKVDAMRAMGADVRAKPHAEIMDAMRTTDLPFAEGRTYVHPFGDPLVAAGAGTVGLEICRQIEQISIDPGRSQGRVEVARALPRIGTVLVPVGGGGLALGVATAVKALHSTAKVFGVQAEGAGPLPKSFQTGKAEDVGAPRTFADGMAATRVFDYMWPLLRARLDGAFAVTDAQLQAAVVHLAKECHVVAEGAGAAGLAAARAHPDVPGPAVCIVSGGNIDPALLARFLAA